MSDAGIPVVNDPAVVVHKPMRASRGRQGKLPESLREIARIDRRSPIGRDVSRFRAALMAIFDNAPGPVQSALIAQACQLKIRLGAMDAAFADTGEMSAHASRTYLAWSNSMTRLLREIEASKAAVSASKPKGAEWKAFLASAEAGKE